MLIKKYTKIIKRFEKIKNLVLTIYLRNILLSAHLEFKFENILIRSK